MYLGWSTSILWLFRWPQLKNHPVWYIYIKPGDADIFKAVSWDLTSPNFHCSQATCTIDHCKRSFSLSFSFSLSLSLLPSNLHHKPLEKITFLCVTFEAGLVGQQFREVGGAAKEERSFKVEAVFASRGSEENHLVKAFAIFAVWVFPKYFKYFRHIWQALEV